MNPSTLWLVLPLLGGSCSGAEADKAPSEPVGISPCKGDDNYRGFQTEVDSLNALRNNQKPAPSRELLGTPSLSDDSASTFVSAGPHLIDPAASPVWLECVEWHMEGQTLEVQHLNFRDGCGVEWSGSSSLKEGELLVHLDNDRCATAGCGNCSYDLRTQVQLPDGPKDVTFLLELNTSCNGELELSLPWLLPLESQPSGIQCKPADIWAAEKAARMREESTMKYLYAGCAQGLLSVSCGGGTECIQDSCLLPCLDSTECPLDGALTCTDGYCLLPE